MTLNASDFSSGCMLCGLIDGWDIEILIIL